MTVRELEQIRRRWLDKHLPYQMIRYDEFDYSILSNIMYRRRAGRGSNTSYNDCIIMLDTETSKAHKNTITYNKDGTIKYIPVQNHIVAWTLSIRAFNRNIVTLYGQKPSEVTDCIKLMQDNMNGEDTIIYVHNLSYDYVFLRKFLFREFGFPEKQLNTKSHNPIYFKWDNGLIIKDSLILAQRSLEKWAKDLDVEHQKAVGKWDYDKIRSQTDEEFSKDELEYIEHDTLAGVECLDKLRIALNKSIYSMPFTATGIPREACRTIGKDFHARDKYKRVALTYDQYRKAERCFHGGFTHANRYMIDLLITELVRCFDFSSSYPFTMLAEKFPAERFTDTFDRTVDDILSNSDNYAYMFKLVLLRPRLKDAMNPMPALQFFKCTNTINAILDNGRILAAEYAEIYLTEIDLKIIADNYIWDNAACVNVSVAYKEYLPRWFTDFVYQCYIDKTMLKGGDPVLYALAKAKLNSLYGMCVQKNIRDNIMEDFLTGDYIPDLEDPEDLYNKFVKKANTILPYQWGIYVTSYAMRNLFELGKCCEKWVYSDTDSVYGINWDMQKVESYNNNCKKKLMDNNYPAVIFNNREYWLGIAESDPEEDSYTEFKVMGAKRYCGRNKADGELHITVAGVPKKTGAKVLRNNINNFTKGLVFDGLTTGKLTHTYCYTEDIYIDDAGNEVGDYIDLNPCDYLLDSVDWESLFTEEIEVQIYEE